jgi:hypothetical protein
MMWRKKDDVEEDHIIDPLDRLRDRACSLNALSVLSTLGQCMPNNWHESKASRGPSQSRPASV